MQTPRLQKKILRKKTSATKKTLQINWKKNSENFKIAPTTANEISDLIHNLKSSKSVGHSIPTKIMKIAEENLFTPLSAN